MKALLQRVTQASVSVANQEISSIQAGLLVLLGIEKDDTEAKIPRMAERILGYRMFQDQDDKMNLNVEQIGGEILVVSQFTLAADTKQGMRAGFSTSAAPERALALYQGLIMRLEQQSKLRIQTGEFGANMQVSLVNDGPVTFLLAC